MRDVDDDGGEVDRGGHVPAPVTSRPATPRREQRSGKTTDEKADQEHADKHGGLLDKDTVGSALDKVMPGTEDVVEKVPDWAWPFRAYLTTVADPGTPVELEVTATDPETDAVTVTATLTATDGPAESAPLEVAVTVTPADPESPSEPATVAVEVTNTDTGESATTERETTPEAVTVTATVVTVAALADVLQEDYAPAA
ncbi:hypothetical protein AB0D86_01685 [Streptomyces sp. NPDC048324]|uniref:hypothetical protein n=1 Tax=Streptomyces sp. NPDC048324 TaxID=3157205 RepID=UPI00343EFB3F